MKRFKRALALLLTVLLLGTLFGCGKKDGNETAPEDTQELQEDLTQLAASSTMCYSNGSVTLHFTCDENGKWFWRDDPEFPLDESYILTLTETVREMAATAPAADAGDPASHGLDSQKKYLTTTNEKGESLTFYFGDKTDDGAYYMSRGDAPEQVYIAPAALTDQLDINIFDMMLLPELPRIDPKRAHTITVSGPEEMSFTLTRDADGKWGGAPEAESCAEALLQEMAAITVDSALDYQPSDGVAELCGLDVPAAVLTVDYINTVEVESSFTMTVGAERDGRRCVLIGEDTTIYLINAELLQQLLTLAEKGV